MNIQSQTDKEDNPLTREDVTRLLQEAGNSARLNLSGRNLQKIDLSLFPLSKANLSRADLSGAKLTYTELVGANLSEANFSDAHVDHADLSGALLSKAILTDASFTGADFTDANLSEAFILRTNFSEATLAGAIGLDEKNTKRPEPLLPTLRIRIVEDPLTLSNLNSIISSLTELSTKYWLIAKGRFADLIEYTQTHNDRFAEEAGSLITRITYNSPFNMDVKVDLSAPSVAEALVKTIDGIKQSKTRHEQADLETQKKAQEIKYAEQVLVHEKQMSVLEEGQKRLEIEQKRLEIQEKQLEVQKKVIENAMEIASNMVDLLYPGADPATRAMEIQVLLPNLVRLQNGKGLELALPITQDNQTSSQQH